MKFSKSDNAGNQLLVYTYETPETANTPAITRILIDACNVKREQLKLRDILKESQTLDTVFRKLKEDLQEIDADFTVTVTQKSSALAGGKVQPSETRIKATQAQVSNVLKNALYFVPSTDCAETERKEILNREPFIPARENSYRE